MPRNHTEAMELDRKNGNTKWAEYEDLETSQVKEYGVFHAHDHEINACSPEGYKKTTVHFIYAAKHDGSCHKS